MAPRRFHTKRSKPNYMAQDSTRLVWIDMEMTGLDPERDRIIEVAMIITDSDLKTIVESPEWVVHQQESCLGGMDEWNRRTHGSSGLLDRVRASKLDETSVERAALAFVEAQVPRLASPLCGNSVGQDRRFLQRYMPRLEAWFHYRNIDVSTLKELCRRWRPEVASRLVKRSQHTALADIRESIEELRFYREHFLRL